MNPSFYSRHRICIFVFFSISAPLVISSADRAVEKSSTRVADWLPESFEETKRLDWFQQHFVSDDLLMVSWEGCTFEDQRLPALAVKLRQPVRLDGKIEVQLTRQIITGPEVMDQLQEEPLDLSRQAALIRLRGWLTGENLQTTCLILLLSDEGWYNRRFLLNHLYDCAREIPGLEPQALHIAGTTADSVAIDQATREGLQWMVISCYLVGCALMGYMFRSLVLTATIFVTAVYCQQMSLALIEVTGGHMDSVMLMIPSLLYVLSISAGVHLANYYRDAVQEQGLTGAPLRAVRHALLPCGLASATTALGLGSLGVSHLIPVRNFGLYSAVGILLATVVVFLLVPALLEQFPAPCPGRMLNRESGTQSRGRWDRLMQWVARHAKLIMLTSAIGLVISFWGVTQIRTGARVHDLFSSDSKILRDYDWLEKNIGPLVPLEIVVRMPHSTGGTPVTTADRLRIVGAVHGTIEDHPGIGSVVSPLNFSPRITRRGRSARDVSREALLNKQLTKNRSRFVEMNLLRETPSEELWRVSARAYAGEALNYSQLLEELQESVDPILRRNASRGLEGIQAVYCGGVPLVQKAQEQMLRDLINSFVLAFALITATMISLSLVGSADEFLEVSNSLEMSVLVVRRVLAGLISMIPNVIPCAVVLGAMGLVGVHLDIGSIMTASVALGIAVDDTLHFITWFRRGLLSGQTRTEAVRYAYSRCATAMTQTSLICGLGLLTFGFSSFVPIARFAWVMFAMLMAALIADLVVLPAVLLSPLGAAFERLRSGVEVEVE